MNALLRILRAAHCRSTHHFFAIDALPLIQTVPGKHLVSQLLRYHGRYLRGAKDPDTRFRDFQNHVVHVDDGYWGGAPRVAHKWYDRLQQHLDQGNMGEAAYAAGVLSHYFTDPIQPLHTAQSDVETVLHRPIEWSITKSYDALYQDWVADPERTVFQLSDQPGWLGDAILQSARVAHRSYQRLLTDYDLVIGKRRPEQGLSDGSRREISDLIGLAVTGWARVLERAADDAQARTGRAIPQASTTLATVMAGVRIPDQMFLRRIEDRREREEVTALVEEFRSTGQLVAHLPPEVRVVAKVREIYRREKQFKSNRIAKENAPRTQEIIEEAVIGIATPEPVLLAFAATESKTRLQPSDPIVDAPSIGTKTAGRFKAVGVSTVAEFLAAEAEDMRSQLDTSWITAELLRSWQHQAQLMCVIPDMLARETQLLVGAGFPSIESISKQKAPDLFASVERYANTPAGQRDLRGGQIPTLERIQSIAGDAALAFVKQKRAAAANRNATESIYPIQKSA